MSTNILVFDEDIFGRRDDGRRYLIVPAGVPITDSRARQLGIVPFKPDEPGARKLPQPSEIKQPVPVELEKAIVAEETAVNATDSAIQLAAEHGIDLAGVVGTGKGGRVIMNDVIKLIAAQ